MESIEIPKDVTTIGNNCFKGCSSLRNVTFPSSIQTCGWVIFTGCNNLNIIFGDRSYLIIDQNLIPMKKEQTNVIGYFGSEENITKNQLSTQMIQLKA